MAAQKPLDVLHGSLGSPVIVSIKGGVEYRGKLKGYDMHMNLVLQNADEIKDGNAVRRLGVIIIRGDSVVSISP
ncbi:MAG: LSM domain-containing protein [Candidatus Hydrothermarchaeaceae archaeon]